MSNFKMNEFANNINIGKTQKIKNIKLYIYQSKRKKALESKNKKCHKVNFEI